MLHIFSQFCYHINFIPTLPGRGVVLLIPSQNSLLVRYLKQLCVSVVSKIGVFGDDMVVHTWSLRWSCEFSMFPFVVCNMSVVFCIAPYVCFVFIVCCASSELVLLKFLTESKCSLNLVVNTKVLLLLLMAGNEGLQKQSCPWWSDVHRRFNRYSPKIQRFLMGIGGRTHDCACINSKAIR